MLVLSRKKNEQIVIGDNIEITVCRIDKDRVKLGLRAPKDVNIRRAELRALHDEAPETVAAGGSTW